MIYFLFFFIISLNKSLLSFCNTICFCNKTNISSRPFLLIFFINCLLSNFFTLLCQHIFYSVFSPYALHFPCYIVFLSYLVFSHFLYYFFVFCLFLVFQIFYFFLFLYFIFYGFILVILFLKINTLLPFSQKNCCYVNQTAKRK